MIKILSCLKIHVNIFAIKMNNPSGFANGLKNRELTSIFTKSRNQIDTISFFYISNLQGKRKLIRELKSEIEISRVKLQ